MTGVFSSGLLYLRRFFVRRLGRFILLAISLLLLWVEHRFYGFAASQWCWNKFLLVGAVRPEIRLFLAKYSLLALLTLFLAFANLYLKVSTRAPDLQRRLSLRFFRNFAFLIYFSIYLFLALLAFHFFLEKNDSWVLAAAGAALAGITAANADIKFGGFSLQPLAEFLAALEAVVEASISTQLIEFNIARRASLRDRLVGSFNAARLEQECILIGHPRSVLNDQLALAGGTPNDVYKGLLAVLIIINSEANAHRLIDETSGDFFRLRFGLS
jgi:hypothetical protein